MTFIDDGRQLSTTRVSRIEIAPHSIPENHRTQSQYNDALIIKLFAFQFTNAYASLFYTAFFRDEQQEIKGVLVLLIQRV